MGIDLKKVRAMRAYPWFEILREKGFAAADVGLRNERQVNGWRLFMIVLLALVSLLGGVRGGWFKEDLVGLAFLGVGLAYTSVVAVLLRYPATLRWVQYSTVSVDTSLVTAALLTFMMVGRGIVAVNSQTSFLLYFIAIALTGRRFDVRLAMFGGALLLVEYTLLVAAGHFAYGLPQVAADPNYGAFSWPMQLGRALILVVAVAVMIDTVARSRPMRDSSIRDPLLGIYNRHYFEEVLALEFEYSRKLGNSMTVVMLDLDGFKAYNQTHGRLKGDALLVAVADFLLRNLRRNDVLARFGGDEFVFLLMETPPEGAGVTLNRLQKNMDRWLKDMMPQGAADTGFSFGLAVLEPHDATPGQLLGRASDHLQLAKGAGGGVICDEEGRILPAEVGSQEA